MTNQNNFIVPKKSFTTLPFYPWLVISLSAAFLFYKYILQVSPSIMTNQLMHEFHLHAAGLGNLAASFFYSFLITQFFSGILLDKYNPRLLTTAALSLCALGAYCFSQTNTVLFAGLSRALMGTGAAFATVSYIKMTSIWFSHERFAFVCGLLASAAMLGAIFGQAPLDFFVQKVGWRGSLVWCAFLGLIIAALFLVLVRNNTDTSFKTVSSTVQTFSFHYVLDVLKKKQNWLLTLYSGLIFSPIDAFAGLWSIPFLKEVYQLSHAQAAMIVSFVFMGLGIGSPILGLLSDTIGKRRPIMLVSAIITFISITIVIYYPYLPLSLLASLLFLFGFSTSAFMLGFALGTENNKSVVTATVISLINTGDVIFSALTEPLIGKLLDLCWDGRMIDGTIYFSTSHYRIALSLLPIYIFIALLLLLFIRENPLSLKK